MSARVIAGTHRCPPAAPASRFGALLLAVLAAGEGTLSSPALALDFPRPGVVCDRKREICYEREGPSLPQTRRAYGARAERRLLDQLSGRPPVREILFSSGELCDLRLRLCWDDGSLRSNQSFRLTRQLFGTAVSGDERRCRLTRRGRPFFDGSCHLERWGNTYQVETEGDRRYRFESRDGRLFLRDATGIWPVSVLDRGNDVLFRWADVQLTVSGRRQEFPSGWGGQGWSEPPTPAPGSGGEALQQLIQNLFR